MSKAARTIQFWSFYLIGLGLILLVAPNLLLALFGFPAANDVWIRVAGMLLLIMAYYFYEAARLEVTPFFKWSVNARVSVIVVFIAFVLLDLAPPQLILFGTVDLLAALWTRSALRTPRTTGQWATKGEIEK